MEDNKIMQFIKDLWRVMLDHPWYTTLISVFVLNLGSPLILIPFWIAVGIDRSSSKK